MVDLIYGRGATDLIREVPFLLAYLKNMLALHSLIQSLQYMALWTLTIFVICIAVIVIGG